VSVKDRNTNNSIAVFTDFNYHIQWVRQLYNEYTSYVSDKCIFYAQFDDNCMNKYMFKCVKFKSVLI